MAKEQNLATLVAELQDRVSILKAEITGVREKRRSLLEEAARESQKPYPKADMLAAACEGVDRGGENYKQTFKFVGGRTAWSPPLDFLDQVALFPLGLVAADRDFFSAGHGLRDEATLRSAMNYFFGDLIKSRLRALFDEIEWPAEVGLPRAARLARLAEIEAAIAALDAREAELLAALEGATVN